jgi:TrmH family RNA methyltransferase
MKPRIVLVRPLYGGNVGAAARAMANMGLEDLRLVDPQYDNEFEVQLMAKGAARIIEQAQRHDEPGEAVGDCSVVVACTARPRSWKAWKVLAPGEAAQLLMDRARAGEPVALLFGSEDRGLLQDDLAWASHLCHIPTGAEHSSLNLAQAVLLMGWECAQIPGDLTRRSFRNRPRVPVPMDQVQGAAEQIGELLDRIGFFRGRNRAQSLATIRQVMLRGEMTDTEVHFLRGVVNKLRWYVDHGPRAGEVDAEAPSEGS